MDHAAGNLGQGLQTNPYPPAGPVAGWAGWSGAPVAVLRGGLAVGGPSYDAVLVEHVPQMPGGNSCRCCGFVYADQPTCPAVILAEAGHPDLADRIRIIPAADRDHTALCELTVAMQRMAARLDAITATPPAAKPRRSRTRLGRIGSAK